MYLFARRNISSVFIDPMGPPGNAFKGPSIRFVEAAAAPSNLRALLRSGGLRAGGGGRRPEVDFLKVDVDGCDCSLAAAALRIVRAKVVVMEINMSIPPPMRFSRQCHPDWRRVWHRWLYGGRTLATHGCSLSAAVAEMRLLGYSLRGLADAPDAVFVREDLAELLGGADLDEFACYAEAMGSPPYYMPFPWVREWSGLPPEEALGRVWCNLTMHDWTLGISHIPFSLTL